MENVSFNRFKVIFGGTGGNIVTVLKDGNTLERYSNIPNKIIYPIMDFWGIHIRSEMCMIKGKAFYKVCQYIGSNGGTITLFGSYSKAKINRYIINFTRDGKKD